MKTTCLAGIFVGAVLVGASPSLAQDKGKTEAAELASKSQKALEALAKAHKLQSTGKEMVARLTKAGVL